MKFTPRYISLAFLIIVSIVFGCASAANRDPVQAPSRELSVAARPRTVVLDNGLAIVVEHDPFLSSVHFGMHMKVGRRDDPEERKQLSHLVEHLMFALPEREDGAASLILGSDPHSLDTGAFVAQDYTYYQDTIERAGLEAAFERAARRLDFDCDELTPEAFATAREVIRNENRARGRSSGGHVREQILEAVFPPGHPYRDEIGNVDLHLAATSQADACEFIEQYYTPSRAAIAVVGNVSVEEVLVLADTYLVDLRADTPTPREPARAVEFGGTVTRLQSRIVRPAGLVLFEMPRPGSEDWAAAALAVTWVELGLSVAMRPRDSPIRSASVVRFGGEDVDVLGVYVEPLEWDQTKAAVEKVQHVLGQVFSKDVNLRLHDHVRQRHRTAFIRSMASAPSRARHYAREVARGRPPQGVGRDLDTFAALQPHLVTRLGRRLFASERSLVIELEPDRDFLLDLDGQGDEPERAELDFEPSPDQFLAVVDEVDPAQASRPLSVPDIAPPDFEELDYTLANGMKVLLVRSSQFPVVDARLIVHAGREAGGELPFLADLAVRGYGLHEGHRFGRGRDAHALMQHFRQAGATLSVDLNRTSTSYRAQGLSIYLDFIMAGLAERVVQGEYQSGALPYFREVLLRAWDRPSWTQEVKAKRVFGELLYGKDHPFADPGVGTRRSVKRIGPSDLSTFHDRHYRADNCTLVVVGDFEMNLATEYVEAFFGSPRLRRRGSKWLEPAVHQSARPSVEPKPGAPTLLFAERPKQPQAVVTMAFPLAQVFGDEHAALLVLAEMMDLQVRSVRESLAASYGFSTLVDTDTPKLLLQGDLDVERAGEGFVGVQDALERIRGGEDFERYFVLARKRAFHKVAALQGDAPTLGFAMVEALSAGQPHDYYPKLAKRLATIRPQEVRALAQRVLDPARTMVMLVGPAQAKDRLVKEAGLVLVEIGDRQDEP